MDVAEAELNRFIDRQATRTKEQRAGQDCANALEQMWRDSERRHVEGRRRKNRALWFAFFCRQADNHARIARDYEARAEALCEEAGRG